MKANYKRNVIIAALALALATARAADVTFAETKAIAEEAFIYGLPLVMNYTVFYEYFVDKSGPEYKAPPNQLYNTARVYGPQDTAIVTPNSDTPYSFVAMDLRAEPFVVCNPEIEKSRYFSVQLVDMYTFNFGYMGTRTTGNGAGCSMIAGPSWKGEKPEGIGKLFRSETDFSFALIRTQLLNPADIDNVKKIQAGYRAMPLSKFQNKPAPTVAPGVKWPKVDKKMADADPFAYLNFVLTLCPPTGPAAVEVPMRARFAKIGVEAGKPFPVDKLSAEQKAGLEAGMKDGQQKIKQFLEGAMKKINGWEVASAFGDRAFYHGDWLLRAAAATAGIYGNDAAEAVYPFGRTDADGQPLDGSKQNYTLTFASGEFPPVNAFWSVTMYDGKTQLLIKNPINRYLINSPMLPQMKKNDDRSLTLYIQKDSPGKDKESNWLPAPNGPIYLVMRLYWPKTEPPSILPPGEGTWKPPGIVKVK
jgi:hypothetical protein